MRTGELFSLTEILDTRVIVKWTTSEYKHRGKFILDDVEYEIQMDEYEANLPSGKMHIVDFGFNSAGSWDMTNRHTASKVLGGVLHEVIKKIKEFSPDGVLFGINFRNGAIESRKSFYERLANLYSKGSSFHFSSKWFSTKNGEYKIISKKSLSDADIETIERLAKSIDSK